MSPTLLAPLVIAVGVQNDGVTYVLEPASARRVQEAFPGRPRAPRVYLGRSDRAPPGRAQRPLWPQVVALLVGAEAAELRTLGSVEFWFPQTDERFPFEP